MSLPTCPACGHLLYPRYYATPGINDSDPPGCAPDEVWQLTCHDCGHRGEFIDSNEAAAIDYQLDALEG